jgi:hypothetical protein
MKDLAQDGILWHVANDLEIYAVHLETWRACARLELYPHRVLEFARA